MSRLAGVLLLACSLLSCDLIAQSVTRLQVYVSIPPQKFLLEQIGGDRLDVRVLLQPGHSPETFDPSPRQIARLSSADLYFCIGVPFEAHWMDVITSRNPSLHGVDCMPAENTDKDPHTWTDPILVLQLSETIMRTLCQLDPGHTDYYESNFRELKLQLQQLDIEIRNQLDNRQRDHFIVTHDSWSYFATRYGLVQLAMESFGRQKGPRGLAELVDLARETGTRTIFTQPQHPTSMTNMLAAELGAELVALDPLAEDYINNMREVSYRIAESLR